MKVGVNNRLWMRLDDLPVEVANELRKKFEHRNPEYFKKVSQGYAVGKETPVIKTWKHQAIWPGGGDLSGPVTWLTLPRGGTDRLRDVCGSNGISIKWVSNMCRGDVSKCGGAYTGDWLTPQIFPNQKQISWDHQARMVKSILKNKQGVVRAPTGCITGDAMIGVNRGGKGSQMRLSHIVKMHNGGKSFNRVWNLDIPTRVRARMDDSTVRLVNLVDAYESGVKEVYQVTLASGHQVTATKDHRFMTVDGWCRLGAMSMGDLVYVEESRRPTKGTEKKSKPWYKLRTARYHPCVGRKGVKPAKGGYTVPEHRLVAEARLNNMPLETLIRRCNDEEDMLEGLMFLDPKKWAVHHDDENPRNNHPDNLVVMTHVQHRQTHRGLALKNIAVRTVPSEVTSISYAGEAMTYDLALEAPHNFLANGVTVHNSGKTSALIEAIRQANVPAIVIVWESGLLEQWQKRIHAELGIKVKDQGLIQGGKCRLRPITLAMQQTMNQWSDVKWEQVNGVFGFVGADELQRYAAATFVDTIDHFDAEYRIGVSADETRRDRKEFLIYDFFGRIIEDIPKKELEGKGIIHEVTCNVTPTDFKADWYAEDRDFSRLLGEIISCPERNARIVQETKHRYDAGETILLFSHRIEHCHTLRSMLAEVGVPADYMLGGVKNQADFVTTVERMRNLKDPLRVAIGTLGKVGVGLDIPNLTVGIACTPIHNNKQFMNQVKGRICRACKPSGKTGAELVYIWDREVYGRQPLINLKKWNQYTNVVHLGQWVDVDQYLKEYHEETERDDDSNGLFATAESFD